MAGLARVVIRFRYVVIAGWLIAAALCVLLLPSLAESVNTDNSTFLPASTPTQHALVLAAPFQPAGTTTGTLVVVGKAKLSSSDQSDITSLEAKIAKDNHVVSVSDQGVSTDGKAQKALVVINVSNVEPRRLADRGWHPCHDQQRSPAVRAARLYDRAVAHGGG